MTAATLPPAAIPYFDEPVLVTGLPRSGTSLVAGLLGVCGLWLGQTVPGGRENPRGFFENVLLRERLQKELLKRGNFDPLGVRRLPPPDWQPMVPNFRDVVGQMLAAQGYVGQGPWGFKDAKMTLTWRIWSAHFPRARWIVVRRPSDQVIASCLRTSFMRHHSEQPDYWRGFAESYVERLAQLEASVEWCRNIDSPAIVGRRYEELEQLAHDLGLTWRAAAVEEFVAPEHWHSPQTPAT